MKRFLAILVILAIFVAIAVTDGKTKLYAAFPTASTEVETAHGRKTGSASLLMLYRGATASTLTLDDVDAITVLELLKADVKSVYEVDGATVIEAHSTMLRCGVSLPHGVINLMIAVRADCIKVGIPTLVGAY